MIITALISVILSLFSFLLNLFPSVPSFPDSVSEILSTLKDYMVSGMSIVNAYVYGNVVVTLITVTLAVAVAHNIYVFVMWVLRKIPMLGIE